MDDAEFQELRAEYNALKKQTLTPEGMRHPEPRRLLDLRVVLEKELAERQVSSFFGKE